MQEDVWRRTRFRRRETARRRAIRSGRGDHGCRPVMACLVRFIAMPPADRCVIKLAIVTA